MKNEYSRRTPLVQIFQQSNPDSEFDDVNLGCASPCASKYANANKQQCLLVSCRNTASMQQMSYSSSELSSSESSSSSDESASELSSSESSSSVVSFEDTSMCESTRGCFRGLGRGLRTTTYSALFVETGVWLPVFFAWAGNGLGNGISSVVSAMAKTEGSWAALVPLRLLDTGASSASSTSDESEEFCPRRASASRILSWRSSSSRCWT